MFTNQALPSIPDNYKCCLSLQIMVDPVMAADGHTYEREEIEKHLKNSDKSPKTNLKLDDKKLVQNHDKRGDIIEFLEKYPAFYNTDDVYVSEALKQNLKDAIKKGDLDTVKTILKKQKGLLLVNLENGYQAFHLAAQFGSLKLTNELFEQLTANNLLAQVVNTPQGFIPIYLNQLLEQELDTQEFDIKNCAEADLLLKLGAEVEQQANGHNTLLHRMVLKGNLSSVDWLLQNGAKLESMGPQGNTALLLATASNKPELVKLLLSKGANVKARNAQKQTPILIALVANQNKAILSLLVGDNNASLPPLHLALALGDKELFKNLLEQKSLEIDINAKNAQGKSCLEIVIIKDDVSLVAQLLHSGANPDLPMGPQNLTAVQWAVSEGNLPFLKVLVEAKASLEMIDGDGNTLLHNVVLAKKEHEALITYLLENKVDQETKNDKDQTPMDVARERKQIKIANFIEASARKIKREREEQLLRRMAQLEQENINLKKMLSSGAERKEERDLPAASAAQSFLPSQAPKVKNKPKVDNKDVQTFLDHVVWGREEKRKRC